MGRVWIEITPELVADALEMPGNTEIIGATMVVNRGFPVIQFIVESPDLPEREKYLPITQAHPIIRGSEYCPECNRPTELEWDWNLQEIKNE